MLETDDYHSWGWSSNIQLADSLESKNNYEKLRMENFGMAEYGIVTPWAPFQIWFWTMAPPTWLAPNHGLRTHALFLDLKKESKESQ